MLKAHKLQILFLFLVLLGGLNIGLLYKLKSSQDKLELNDKLMTNKNQSNFNYYKENNKLEDKIENFEEKNPVTTLSQTFQGTVNCAEIGLDCSGLIGEPMFGGQYYKKEIAFQKSSIVQYKAPLTFDVTADFSVFKKGETTHLPPFYFDDRFHDKAIQFPFFKTTDDFYTNKHGLTFRESYDFYGQSLAIYSLEYLGQTANEDPYYLRVHYTRQGSFYQPSTYEKPVDVRALFTDKQRNKVKEYVDTIKRL